MMAKLELKLKATVKNGEEFIKDIEKLWKKHNKIGEYNLSVEWIEVLYA